MSLPTQSDLLALGFGSPPLVALAPSTAQSSGTLAFASADGVLWVPSSTGGGSGPARPVVFVAT